MPDGGCRAPRIASAVARPMRNAGEVEYLTPSELSKRWAGAVTPGTLAAWRSRRQGPSFVKFGGRILYRLDDVECFEASQRRSVGDG